MNHQYNLQFEKLCTTLKLGEVLQQPEQLSGGLLHRMFSIETTQGKYAIKALNPQIMARPTAFNNFVNSEKIANLAARSLPAQPALSIDGHFIHCIDQQFYLIFDWIDGQSLKSSEINHMHCIKMGTLVANIHLIDSSSLEWETNHSDHVNETDWRFYVKKGQDNNAIWVEQLNEQMENLLTWSYKAKTSSDILASDQVLSHRDLDPKNVLWNQDKPTIIDWECAGFVNPMHDLIETAIYWSTNESGQIEKEKFLAFISGYQQQRSGLQADWTAILELGYLGKLDWLEYSLKRSLWIECSDEKEQQMGTEQVLATLSSLQLYANTISELEGWLHNIE